MPDDDLYAAYLDGLRTQAHGQHELEAARNTAEQRAQVRREQDAQEKRAAEDAVYRSRRKRMGRYREPGQAAGDLGDHFRWLCKDVGVAVPSELSSYEEAARAADSRALNDDLFDRILLTDERIAELRGRWGGSRLRRMELGLPPAKDTDEW